MSEPLNNNLSETIRKAIRRRYTIVIVLFYIAFVAILVTILRIQFVEGKQWKSLGAKLKMEDVLVPSNRGNILSRDGQLMASTVPYYG